MTTSVKVFLYGGKDLAFAPYGDYWKQARKMCVMNLLRANRVRSFRFIREEEASNMVNKIKQYSSSIGTNVNLSTMIVGATNSIISRASLSRNLEGDMFVAGTNTMYTAVESTMAELMNHPIVMKKLQEEVRRVVGTKSTVDENDINQMSYLNCVVKEAPRLHPSVILSGPRETTESGRAIRL
ncbi:hypothetical protein IFM89_010237 [Coptis chinensis]|uniref:Cytochrome P450 n=1 Tax=Coptis chinensis TaxID=261450 RepID=A0A835ILG3_9MAGN|nr:hypothetical protein IFM89_010237 [Coptis chinensis]